MLSNYSQYSPQAWAPQFLPWQGGSFGHDFAQGGQQPFAFGGQGTAFGQGSPFGQGNAFGANPFPFGTQGGWYGQSPFGANPYAPNPYAQSQLHQIVPVLSQLAQHVAVQSAITQQIGAALHQLAHQLTGQGMQTQQGVGLGGQPPFGAFNPQAQGWGAGRSPTIQ